VRAPVPSEDLRWVRLWSGFRWPFARLRTHRKQVLLAAVPAVVFVAYTLSPGALVAPLFAPSLLWLYLSVVAIVASRPDAPTPAQQAPWWFYVGLLGATSVLAGVLYLATTLLLTLLVALAVAAVFTAAMRLWWRWTRPVRRGPASHVNADGRAKIAYRTAAEAQQAALQYTRDTGGRMNAYRCGTCPGWHIGHAR
jgi:hypothetical protein